MPRMPPAPRIWPLSWLKASCEPVNRQDLIPLAQSCGAHRAALVTIARDMAFDPVFRDICASNACGQYGACHMCPPDVGDIHELIAQASQYDTGLLYQSVGQLEDSFDIEGMLLAARLQNDIAVRIREQLQHLPGLLHLSTGGCRICERCTRPQSLPCISPEMALSSLEAYGIDVYKTAFKAGLKYHHGENTVTYFGMVFFKEHHLA